MSKQLYYFSRTCVCLSNTSESFTKSRCRLCQGKITHGLLCLLSVKDSSSEKTHRAISSPHSSVPSSYSDAVQGSWTGAPLSHPICTVKVQGKPPLYFQVWGLGRSSWPLPGWGQGLISPPFLSRTFVLICFQLGASSLVLPWLYFCILHN